MNRTCAERQRHLNRIHLPYYTYPEQLHWPPSQLQMGYGLTQTKHSLQNEIREAVEDREEVAIEGLCEGGDSGDTAQKA